MKCEYVKKDGKQCGSYAMQDSKFCYFHSPEMVSKRKKASAEGGSKSTLGLEPAEPIQLEQQGSVVALLQDTINRVRRVRKDGSLDVKTANCIGFLASKIVEAKKVNAKEDNAIEPQRVDKFAELWDENPVGATKQIIDLNECHIKYLEGDLLFIEDPLEKLSKEKEMREAKANQLELREMFDRLQIKAKIMEVSAKIV